MAAYRIVSDFIAQTTGWLLNIFAVLVLVTLLLKDYEIYLSIQWAMRHGRDYARAMRRAIAGWVNAPQTFTAQAVLQIHADHGRRWGAEAWPVMRWILSHCGNRSALLLNHIYRWPQLMTALSLAVFVLPAGPVAGLCITMLAANMVLETAHYLANRLQLGAMDSYFRRFADFRIYNVPPPTFDEVRMAPQDLVRDFTVMVGVFMLVLIFSFAAMYYGTANIIGFSAAFPELANAKSGFWTALDMLYFSIITTVTVGYRDFGLASYTLKFLVALHHLCSFAVVLLIVTAFNLTGEATDTMQNPFVRDNRAAGSD